LTHYLGWSDVFLLAEPFKTGLLLGINQNAEAGCPLFALHLGCLIGKGALGQAWGGSAHWIVLH
jgi:hypothetical protein